MMLLACASPDPAAAPPDGVLDEGPLNPFPSVELVADGRLALAEDSLPATERSWDVARLNRREGFSVVQPAVVKLPEPLDPETVPGQAGIATDGPVRMIDLDSGELLPVLAELDANEDAAEHPALIVRPMKAMTPGHSVAVILTGALTSGGAPLALPEPEGHYAELRSRLAALGQTDVQLAWDFPVGAATGPVDGIAAQLRTPTAWSFDRVRTAEEDPPLVEALMQVEGSFTAQDWLVDDASFVLDDDGLPQEQGEVEAYLYVHVPPSVADAPAGSVPILVFGHGIFGEPSYYFGDPDNAHQLEIADRLGAVVVATIWRGLSSDDYVSAIEVAEDFPRVGEITDRLGQGVGNTLALMALAQEGGLFDDPVFADIADKLDRDTMLWFGISLGSIEGAVTLASTDRIDRAVLHVGGADWSTMLERSVQWPPFAMVVSRDYTDAHLRQVAYAASQLHWDQVDPANYADRLGDRAILWQEAMEDDQVPNVTTELLLRSVGAPLGGPHASEPLGIELVELPASGPLLSQFDPETDPATTTNVPGGITDAHTIPRTWEGMKAQTVEFLASGNAAHFCGDAVCSASNPGE